MVLAHHRRQPSFKTTKQIAEPADMWITTYLLLCCGQIYVAAGRGGPGIPLISQTNPQHKKGWPWVYKAFRNAINDGSERR